MTLDHENQYKLITLMVPGHKSIEIMEALVKERFITTANKTNARGISNATGESTEMEVLTIMVEEDSAEDLFEYLYAKAELYNPKSGLIFQQSLKHVTEYLL